PVSGDAVLGSLQRVQLRQLAALPGQPSVGAVWPAAHRRSEAAPAAGIPIRLLREREMFKRVATGIVLLICASGTLISQGRGGRGAAPPGTQKVTAVRAGRIVDPDTGTAAANQVILVEGDRITNVGANLPIPQGAEVIDLS